MHRPAAFTASCSTAPRFQRALLFFALLHGAGRACAAAVQGQSTTPRAVVLQEPRIPLDRYLRGVVRLRIGDVVPSAAPTEKERRRVPPSGIIVDGSIVPPTVPVQPAAPPPGLPPTPQDVIRDMFNKAVRQIAQDVQREAKTRGVLRDILGRWLQVSVAPRGHRRLLPLLYHRAALQTG